ncbi:MAG: phosphotransferase [Candidatus Obscuribacterales bacterium]|nr:phosphotransferase [Candidatus Obscuribacterales bacterium]
MSVSKANESAQEIPSDKDGRPNTVLSIGDLARQGLQVASTSLREAQRTSSDVLNNVRHDPNLALHALEFGAVVAAGVVTHSGAKLLGRELMAMRELRVERTVVGTASENLPPEVINLPKVAESTAEVIRLPHVVEIQPEVHDIPEEKTPPPVVDTRSTEEMQRVRKLISRDTNYNVIGKMERGLNGAYLVQNAEGDHLIFKAVSRDDVTPQINISAKSASAVDSLAGRTPRYEEVRFTPGEGSWYVQTLLEGKPAPNPTDKLIGQMLKLNDRQAGKAIAGSQNWNDKVYDSLFNDNLGWQKAIGRSGEEGKDLVRRVQALAGNSRLFVPRAEDIVHGDFQHYNALVSSTDRLTGYVDWEGAGLGDRSIDMTRLLFDSYVSEAEKGFRANPATLQMMRDRIKDVSGEQALHSGMAYWILQVSHYGTFCDKVKFGKFLNVGRRILDDLEAAPMARTSAA